MFNQLPHNQQQDVVRIMNALDETVKDLRPITAELMPDSSYTNHLEFVRDMVANIVFYNDIQEDSSPYVAETLLFTTTIMAKYIKRGDTLPLEYASDIYILLSSTSHEPDYWQDLIKSNLDTMADYLPNGENVSTAIFKAVLNTAFDCLMND